MTKVTNENTIVRYLTRAVTSPRTPRAARSNTSNAGTPTPTPAKRVVIKSKATKAARKQRAVAKVKKSNKTDSSKVYKSYIKKVFKQIFPDKLKISKKAMVIINDFVVDTMTKVAEEAGNLFRKDKKKKTLSVQDFESAVRLVLPGELSIGAHRDGIKAHTKYTKFV